VQNAVTADASAASTSAASKALFVKWLSDHEDEADCQKHADMGFEVGWGKALDQLVGIADQLRE